MVVYRKKNLVKFVDVVARFEILCSCISLLGFGLERFSTTIMDFFTLMVICLLGHEEVKAVVLDLFSLFSLSSPHMHTCISSLANELAHRYSNSVRRTSITRLGAVVFVVVKCNEFLRNL